MSTQIIKLTSLKSNLQSIFSNLVNRFKPNRNYDITLVIQQSEIIVQEEEESMLHTSNQKSNVVFNENTLILNTDGNEENSVMSDQISNPPHFESENKIIEKKQHKGTSIQVRKNPRSNPSDAGKRSKFRHVTINNYTQTDPVKDEQIIESDLKLDTSFETGRKYSLKINNYDIDSDISNSQSSAQDNDSNAGFLIEKHLNQALQLIESKQIDELEDFLYNYKEKYSFINMRTQTKWSLLMAHCKEAKLQYQRAATNYNQVIKNVQAHPRMLSIDMGDVYFKLGRCYYETRMWNKGIAAYTTALNEFKESKKINQYANCITCLGILYFEINYFIEAEKCFLVGYDIRRHEGDVNNQSNLLPILFNLVDCNLNLKNYNQASDLLLLINQIIINSETIETICIIGYHIKQAKLYFFIGNFPNAVQYCQDAFNMLMQEKSEPKEYGEVLQIMGLIKQQLGQYNKSREYFQRALKAIQNHVPNDSIKLQILKKRIGALMKDSEDKNREPLTFPLSPIVHSESEQKSSQGSDCLDLNLYENQ